MSTYDPVTDVFRYARDLAITQALRRGVDVPLDELDSVLDLGHCMKELEDAEKEGKQ